MYFSGRVFQLDFGLGGLRRSSLLLALAALVWLVFGRLVQGLGRPIRFLELRERDWRELEMRPIT